MLKAGMRILILLFLFSTALEASNKSIRPEFRRTKLHYLFGKTKVKDGLIRVKGPKWSLFENELFSSGNKFYMNPEELKKEQSLGESVFRVSGVRADNHGTAFYVGGNMLLTNFHVYDSKFGEGRKCGRFSIKTAPKHKKVKPKCLEVIHCNEPLDFCLIKLKSKKFPNLDKVITPLKLQTEINITREETVYHIGNPSGYGLIGSSGFNSSIDSLGRIRHYAPLFPGSSGGPLFSKNGEVIGVNHRQTVIAYGEKAANFAVPIKSIFLYLEKVLLNDILEKINFQK